MQVKSTSTYSAKSRSGFTLLEILVVIGLALLISGIGIFYMAGPQTEEELRTEHAKVEDFVMQARTFAVSYQQSFVVRFKEGVFEMEPKARPELATYEEEDEYSDTPRTNLRSLGSQSWPRREVIEGDYFVEVRRWGTDNFIPIVEREEQTWIFDPNGLCEPVAVRISKDDGRNTITRVFHPLTGLAADEATSIDGK